MILTTLKKLATNNQTGAVKSEIIKMKGIKIKESAQTMKTVHE